MAIKPLAEIAEVDLRALIAAGASESRHLEFKRELPSGSDSGKVSFLRTVTAFANTDGGDVFYGVAATDGVATNLSPLEINSQDEMVLRLEQLCGMCIEPRLTSIQFRWIDLVDGGAVLLVRIPRSWNAPHRVRLANHQHFYLRNAAGVSQMDVQELRRAFTQGGELAARIRAFRDERLITLNSGQGAIPLRAGALLVLHVIPLQSFATDIRLEVASNASALSRIYPIGARGFNDRLNLDGRLTYRILHEGRSNGYAQLYRNGVIETVSVEAPYNDSRTIGSVAYERDILAALGTYLPALRELGLETPVYVFLSLVGVVGYQLAVSSRMLADEVHAADRDVLAFPEITFTTWDQDIPTVMRPMFDMVWNAFGFQRSFNYDSDGRWVGR